MQLPPTLNKIVKFLAHIITPDVRKQAAIVYPQLMAQAREPWIYRECKVPDTLDGRFEILLLHVFLYLRQVKAYASYKDEYKDFIQAVMEFMFDDMDQALREMGVGDMGISKRIRVMGEALFGRFNAYEEALEDKNMMIEALVRNVYGTMDNIDRYNVEILYAYLEGLKQHFASTHISALLNGILHLPHPKKLLG